MTVPTDHFDPKEWADIYDAHVPKSGHRTFRRARDLARDVCLRWGTPGQLWIEAGCGTGHLAADLSAAGLRPVAFDHDVEMVRMAHQTFGGSCLTAKAEKFPFADHVADGVVAVSMIGCLQELQPLLKELHRVLKPQGLAVLTFTNRKSHLHRINRFFRKPEGFYRAYSLPEVTAGLKQAGLEIKIIRFYNFFLDRNRMFPGEKISNWLETSLPNSIGSHLGRNLLVLAEATPRVL